MFYRLHIKDLRCGTPDHVSHHRTIAELIARMDADDTQLGLEEYLPGMAKTIADNFNDDQGHKLYLGDCLATITKVRDVTTDWPNGLRVRISHDIAIYPLGIFQAGLTGTVVRTANDGDGIGSPMFNVRLDETRPELSMWENELQVWLESHRECRTADFAAIDTAAIARMGYPDMIDAASFTGSGSLVDIGLIGPGGAYGDQWAVAIHTDCNPERQTDGSSELTTYETLSEAVADYEARVLLAREFPDFDQSTLPEIPAGFVAQHWHHDSCLTWTDEAARLMLHVDYADPALREFPDGHRFGLSRIDADGQASDVITTADDFGEIRAAISAAQLAALADKWVARFNLGFHPDTPGDQYVYNDGSRCLTDDEAAVYDADMETMAGLGDQYEAGIEAWKRAGLL